MKKFNLLAALGILFFSCGSDSDSVQEAIIEEVPKIPVIESYSKNYGYATETLSILGSNFIDTVENIDILFDDVNAQVTSASATEIKFVLPASEKLIPKLTLKINGSTVTNIVENDYQGNIGILTKEAGKWLKIPNPIISDEAILNIQPMDSETIYYSLDEFHRGDQVLRTKDGGISWIRWATTNGYGAFYATKNDEGWSTYGAGHSLSRLPVGGEPFIPIGLNLDVGNKGWLAANYVEDNMKNGIVVASDCTVYKTVDSGETFNEIYQNSVGSFSVESFYAHDINNIWVGGTDKISDLEHLVPLMLYANGDNSVWKEVYFPAEKPGTIEKIQFLDTTIGYFMLNRFSRAVNKIYKTIDGGNSWIILNDTLGFKGFIFKNSTIGWAFTGDKIYKTLDGGLTWNLDYTHNEDIKKITYKDGVCWAISKNEILKYYTE